MPKMASQSSDQRVTITDDAPSEESTQQQLETVNISPQLSTMDGPGDPNEFRYGIREYGSTLYVGLARAVSPANTNFRLTFLLTRLQEALYEDLAV